MLESFSFFREMTPLSVMLRILIAVVFGGLVGLEREYKRRPAGFRTHILICLGACITTMTSQFLVMVMDYPVDLSRLGAQVVAGIGFIGAGTIIVTREQRVKGLTTAAGLWSCAILGLAVGAGFLESAIICVCLILLAELLFVKLEDWLLRNSREYILYIEYSGAACLDEILSCLQEKHARINSMEVTRTGSGGANVFFYIRTSQRMGIRQLNEAIAAISGVSTVEKL